MAPNAGFPPPAADDFPQGIQFQLDGVDLGGTDVTTFNVVAGSSGQPFSFTRGEGENAGVVTLVIPVV
jgi:hypothetical protein